MKYKVSAGVQYAVWFVVAFQLLIPFNIVDNKLNISNYIDLEKINIIRNSNYEKGLIVEPPVAEDDYIQKTSKFSYITNRLHIIIIFYNIRFIVSAIIIIIMIMINLIFYFNLKRKRIFISKKNKKISVYLVKNISSPCLFGFLKPSIYINSEALEGDRLNYILIHEYEHYKHLDHIWSIIRQICIAVYWFNPLVWIAAFLSKYDCETACDESVIKSLGEHERYSYGKTLIDMCDSKMNNAFSSIAVMFVNSYTTLKDRILRVSRRRKTSQIYLLIFMFIIIFALLTCSESGNMLKKNVYGNSWLRYYSEGLSAIYREDGFIHKAGYIDKKGEIKIPYIYKEARPFSEGLAAVKEKNKFGYINKKGIEIISPVFDEAHEFSEGLAAVSKNKKYGYINSDGKTVIPLEYEYGWNFTEGLAAVQKDGKWGFIDKNGKTVIDFKYDFAYYFNENLASVQKNDKLGYINRKGDVVIPFKYEKAREFSNGIAEVQYNGKYGCIDKEGNVVIPFIYDNARQFNEGLIPVKRDNRWGYIDINGKVVIPFIYDDAEHFEEHVAVVCNKGKMQYIKLPKNK